MTRDAGHSSLLTVRSGLLSANSAAVRQRACEDYLHDHQGRTFGAPGLTTPAMNSEDGHEQSRERPARVTRRRRLRFTRGSRRCGAAAVAASFGRKPYGAAAAAHRGPGDRPPAVPAASPLPRPRAPRPGHHPHAGCAGSSEDVTKTRAERRALSGSAPPASRAPEDRF
jgi:hypothetical protein